MRLDDRLKAMHLCRLLFLNFHRVAHISLIQNKSYRQTPEKMKNNGENEK